MIDWTKPLQTRDGRRVRVLATDLVRMDESTVAVAVMSSNGDHESVFSVFPDGRYVASYVTHTDIINVEDAE